MFKSIIEELFEEFDKNNIIYLVERNYSELPERVENDIDILLKDKQLYIAKGIIANVMKKYDYVNVLDGIYLGTNKLIFISKNIHEEIIRLDLNYMFHYKGIKYLNVNNILNNRNKYKNFYIASKDDEIIMSLFTNYINNGYVKEKYKDLIIKNVKLIEGYDNLFFDKSLFNEMYDNILNSDWYKVEKIVKKVRLNILKNNILCKENNEVITLIKILLYRIFKYKPNLIILKSDYEIKQIELKAKLKGMKIINVKNIHNKQIKILGKFNSYLFVALHYEFEKKNFNQVFFM